MCPYKISVSSCAIRRWSSYKIRGASSSEIRRSSYLGLGNLGNPGGGIGWPEPGESAGSGTLAQPFKKLSKIPSRQSLAREL